MRKLRLIITALIPILAFSQSWNSWKTDQPEYWQRQRLWSSFQYGLGYVPVYWRPVCKENIVNTSLTLGHAVFFIPSNRANNWKYPVIKILSILAIPQKITPGATVATI